MRPYEIINFQLLDTQVYPRVRIYTGIDEYEEYEQEEDITNQNDQENYIIHKIEAKDETLENCLNNIRFQQKKQKK
ncbi:hypothetical protein IMG5_067020 [Ichthyophthirius multifiliis]|uniref:Uncharacterized protein n=1 Tax=Ichthyophthirius multifiliis TaxID=5932 RepID=G0QPD7_ICHMU|nr:hypothetical protein IMG5_067020 [Ichthyophthirius multifiliis]EGR32905.1 hypothetical protein IMG5_067020 [Ichthyophthirius multifiliis]|eukprot:XP_004036891.1 hypothetical protein IMG5_067020 [Ichthyophthirius multifiliis]